MSATDRSAPDVPGERDLTETTRSSACVYQGRLLQVREDVVRLPDGSIGRREYIVHPGAAVILAMPDERTVLLERQFRYPLRRHVLELPAGKLDPGEAPLATAQRELLEETGHLAEEWRHLSTFWPVVGYSDERIDLFLARGLTHVGRSLDPGEFLEVLTVPLDQALDWARTGRIAEAKTIMGLLLAEKVLAGTW